MKYRKKPVVIEAIQREMQKEDEARAARRKEREARKK